MKSKKSNKNISDEDIRKLVIERLKILSSGKRISIGSEGEFNKEELIERVKKDDNVGKKITEIQLEYLRSLKDGLFLSD